MQMNFHRQDYDHGGEYMILDQFLDLDQMVLTVANIGGGGKISSFSCSFWEKIGQIIGWHPSLGNNGFALVHNTFIHSNKHINKRWLYELNKKMTQIQMAWDLT